MIDLVLPSFTIFFLTACLLIGIGIGFLLRSIGNVGRIEKAVEQFKKEAEAEKLEISRDLNQQLVQVKESIIKTVEAYSSVARTIQERLPIPPEFETLYSKNGDALRLEVIQVADEKRTENTDSDENVLNNDLRTSSETQVEDSSESETNEKPYLDFSEDVVETPKNLSA